MSGIDVQQTSDLGTASEGIQVTQCLRILLKATHAGETQECELLIPITLMYCGFKIGFLAPLSFENLIAKIIRRHCSTPLSRNAESDSLEELLLGLPKDRFEASEDAYRLVIERVDDATDI